MSSHNQINQRFKPGKVQSIDSLRLALFKYSEYMQPDAWRRSQILEVAVLLRFKSIKVDVHLNKKQMKNKIINNRKEANIENQ